MRKLQIIIVLSILCGMLPVRADEGMWLPSLIEKGRIKDMKSKGFRLKASDLYSAEKASLKDAIVRFGSGCTGELISDQGLLITNHHCGYKQIQQHSSTQHDYLTYGFAAMNKKEELPNPGLVVSFLVEMTDVTDQITSALSSTMTQDERSAAIKKNIAAVVKKATAGTHYQATVESLYYGNQYFLFTYEVFEDVRLVFAPPSSIGKFGGDTDNWMWPRHTGDFSIFRVYASPDNKPAKYSESNVPYVPKSSFTISLKGMQEGDFTFVYGFPGRTSQYLHSEAVRYILEKGDPHKVALRTIRLDVMNAAMDTSDLTRIQYAAKNAGVSNAWKKWQGEIKGLKRLNTISKKQEQERRFEQWADDKPDYKGVTMQLGKLYDSLDRYAFAKDYYSEALFAVEIIKQANSFQPLIDSIHSEKAMTKALGEPDAFFKDYNAGIDRKTAMEIIAVMRKNIPQDLLPESFNNVSIDAFVDNIFKGSILLDQQKLMSVLAKSPTERADILSKDPAMLAALAFSDFQKRVLDPPFKSLSAKIETLYGAYMRGLMLMQSDRTFYPDANSTLRLAYGQVKGYEPLDGVYYIPFTTLEGVMQKDNPAIYDYDTPEALRRIYNSKEYGRWDVNGTVPVAFIATNHTTGGNSGSPVLNGHGELIGINFDRCWEGTMSDIEYDPIVCRNIALDIRYALFIIDKVGGAGYLLDEMKFAK